jgi:polyisoprenyl-teichoic acid--peptidoglycan teichoic acid transferase
MSQAKLPNRPKRKKPDFISIGIVIFFIILGGIAAVVAYNVVNSMISKTTSIPLPGLAIKAGSTPVPGATFDPNSVPTLAQAQIDAASTPQPWDGGKRVNLLLMGLDYRDWNAIQKNEPSRTDSMIVFTFDPISKTAGFLSIPRDMWVTIPGYDNGKINTAHFLGQLNNLPGSGPALATKTVENFLGIKIDYYAEVDFSAFTKFIDAIGCIDLKIQPDEDGLVIDPVGVGNTIVLHKGTQMFCGEQALAYARTRHGTNKTTDNGDFDRARRQQSVIMAMRDQILNIYSLPKLVAIAPQLYDQLSAGIKTNLPLDMAIKLAWAGKDVPKESIKNGVIAADMVAYGNVVGPDGVNQAVIKPLPDKIRVLRDQLFTNDGALGPSQTDMTTALKAEGARISLQNGTQDATILPRTQAYMQSLGLNVVEATNAPQATGLNMMTIYNGKAYAMKFLSETMHIPTAQITSKFTPGTPVDLVIIIGSDWVTNNPMPK